MSDTSTHELAEAYAILASSATELLAETPRRRVCDRLMLRRTRREYLAKERMHRELAEVLAIAARLRAAREADDA